MGFFILSACKHLMQLFVINQIHRKGVLGINASTLPICSLINIDRFVFRVIDGIFREHFVFDIYVTDYILLLAPKLTSFLIPLPNCTFNANLFVSKFSKSRDTLWFICQCLI